jgi:hypothetical protein
MRYPARLHRNPSTATHSSHPILRRCAGAPRRSVAVAAAALPRRAV